MICIQMGGKLVRASDFHKDRFRSITREELYDTPEKRESRIRALQRKYKKMRLFR